MRYRITVRQTYQGLIVTAILSIILWAVGYSSGFIALCMSIAFFIIVMVIEKRFVDMHNYCQDELAQAEFKNLVLDRDIQYYNKVMKIATDVITSQHKKIEELEKSQLCPEEYVNWASILN